MQRAACHGGSKTEQRSDLKRGNVWSSTAHLVFRLLVVLVFRLVRVVFFLLELQLLTLLQVWLLVIMLQLILLLQVWLLLIICQRPLVRSEHWGAICASSWQPCQTESMLWRQQALQQALQPPNQLLLDPPLQQALQAPDPLLQALQAPPPGTKKADIFLVPWAPTPILRILRVSLPSRLGALQHTPFLLPWAPRPIFRILLRVSLS